MQRAIKEKYSIRNTPEIMDALQEIQCTFIFAAHFQKFLSSTPVAHFLKFNSRRISVVFCSRFYQVKNGVWNVSGFMK